ncbi:MAG: hypothetical protein R2911_32515 [Caldilineaceae bacterium]
MMPACRAASKILTVPTTLTCEPTDGLARQNGTCKPAKCTMCVISCCSTTLRTAFKSVTSKLAQVICASSSSDNNNPGRVGVVAKSVATTCTPSSTRLRKTHAQYSPWSR